MDEDCLMTTTKDIVSSFLDLPEDQRQRRRFRGLGPPGAAGARRESTSLAWEKPNEALR